MIVANKKMLADTKKTGTKKREKAGKDDILEYGAFDLFKVLDIDGDGRITRKEYNAGFDIIDTDRNGFLSKIEFGMSSAAPFNLLDQDRDGQLSRKEFKLGFDLFDIHGEGFITKEEWIKILHLPVHHSFSVTSLTLHSHVFNSAANKHTLRFPAGLVHRAPKNHDRTFIQVRSSGFVLPSTNLHCLS